MGLLQYAVIAAFTAFSIQILPGYLSPKRPLHLDGNVDKAWHRVQEAFRFLLLGTSSHKSQLTSFRGL